MSKLMFVFIFILVEGSCLDGEPLSLEDCIKIAINNSRSIKLTENRIKNAKLTIKDAKARFFPTLSLDTSYSISSAYPEFKWDKDHYKANLNLAWTLYDNGATGAEIRKQKINLSIAELGYKKKVSMVAFEVIQDYYNLLKTKELLKVRKEAKKRAEAQVDLVRTCFNAGIAPESDILKAELELNNAEVSLLEAESELDLCYATLSNRMGIEIKGRIEPREEVLEKLEILDKYIDYALQNRLELKELEMRRKFSLISLSRAKKSIYPKITLSGNYTLPIDEFSLKEAIWTIGLSISLPLFNAGVLRRGIKKAQIEIENIELEYQQLLQDIKLEVKRSYLTTINANKRVELADRQLKFAEKNFAFAQGRYKTGIGTIIELMDAQLSLTQALVNRVEALYAYILAFHSLNRAIGAVYKEYK